MENEYLKVDITLDGGNVTSIYDKKKNVEYLYQKDERSWMGQDVIIFPVIGGLKDKEYFVDGKLYSMKNHGLIRYVKLDVVSLTDNKIVLGYKYNEETLKQYPYKFNFEMCYRLNGSELTVEYRVYNLDDKDMYFSVGGHPALIVNGYETDTEFVYDNVKLLFDKDYNTKEYVLNNDGTLISKVVDTIIPKEFVLNKQIIEEAKTLIYEVYNKNEGIGVTGVKLISGDEEFDFAFNCKTLAIWTNPNFGNYLCVEPWWGVPDFESTDKVLENKKLIDKLEPNEYYYSDYKIAF